MSDLVKDMLSEGKNVIVCFLESVFIVVLYCWFQVC